MFKLLDSIVKLEEKGWYITEIEKRYDDYYIIYFSFNNERYYCSVSEFAILCPHPLPNDVREYLRFIQYLIRKEKLERI